MSSVLIVDDEPGYREVLSAVFVSEGYSVATAPHGRAAVNHLKKNAVDVIISDVRMPDMDGIELLKKVRSVDAEIGIVLMTAFGTIRTAREAFKLGADDFVQKPFSNDELRLIVKRTLERRSLANENRAFKLAQRVSNSLDNLVGESPAMKEVIQKINVVARERSTVLITGESGTGKELVARAIHDLSERAERPFVPINCGAVAESLLESELFGFMKGSFTGADQHRPGVIESANGGTLFLDEIGDMPPSMQVKLLRVLQDGRVRRIGATNEVDVDVRVIAATNKDLPALMSVGTFREDLFYRISVFPIHLPPLRDRKADIPVLAEHFAKRFATRSGKSQVTFSSQATEHLRARMWPGNIRELEHTIERAVALTPEGEQIGADRFDSWSSNGTPRPIPSEVPDGGIDLREFIEKIERDLVRDAMRKSGGNRTRAAELVRMEVHQFRYLLNKHRLEP